MIDLKSIDHFLNNLEKKISISPKYLTSCIQQYIHQKIQEELKQLNLNYQKKIQDQNKTLLETQKRIQALEDRILKLESQINKK